MSDLYDAYYDSPASSDEIEVEARDHLRRFFDENRERVFFSRQIEVQNESQYFHWITNRAKYQLYPWTHRALAKRVKDDLGLPVDAPRFLYEGTMNRFLKWHRKNV